MNNEKKLFDNVILYREASKTLLEKVNEEWNGEDGLYRFYHGSFKVFNIKDVTQSIVDHLKTLSDCEFNAVFLQIIEEGNSHSFTNTTNGNWLSETRPVIEAFFHAKAMLELSVKYGEIFVSENITEPPSLLPTGWATLLYLFNLR